MYGINKNESELNPNTSQFRQLESYIKSGMSGDEAVKTYNQTEQSWAEYLAPPEVNWNQLDRPINF